MDFHFSIFACISIWTNYRCISWIFAAQVQNPILNPHKSSQTCCALISIWYPSDSLPVHTPIFKQFGFCRNSMWGPEVGPIFSPKMGRCLRMSGLTANVNPGFTCTATKINRWDPSALKIGTPTPPFPKPGVYSTIKKTWWWLMMFSASENTVLSGVGPRSNSSGGWQGEGWDHQRSAESKAILYRYF